MDRNVSPNGLGRSERIALQREDISEPDQRPQQIGAPGMYANDMVHHILGDIEQARPADKLALLGFLLDSPGSGGPGASSSGAVHGGEAIARARECLETLEVAGENTEEVRSTLIQRLQASLPRYMAEAIQSRSRPGHPHATVGAASMVGDMGRAQAAGAQATRLFADCDNPTKLRLLGFSHSKFFADELGELLGRYEDQKSPFLRQVALGYAFKDGFNEALVEALPQNQRKRFQKILAEPDYDRRRDDLGMAILEFLEDPDANLDDADSLPGNAGVTTTTDTSGGDATTTIASTVTTSTVTTTTTTTASAVISSRKEKEKEDPEGDDRGGHHADGSFQSALAVQLDYEAEVCTNEQVTETKFASE
jgi:hypothetical protein